MSKITVIGSLFFYGNNYKAAVFFSRIELRGDNKVALFKDMAVSLGGSVVFILFRHNPIISSILLKKPFTCQRDITAANMNTHINK